ncbi:MAG: primosomal protein N' [Armatimonadota bacterium]
MTDSPDQPRLFDAGPSDDGDEVDAPSKPQGEASCFARVVVDQAGRGLEREYTYSVPAHLESDLQVGSYVLVPFGRRRLSGWVVSFTNERPGFRVKDVIGTLVDDPVFDERGLELARWMSGHYLASLRDCLRCLLPPGAAREPETLISLTDEGRQVGPGLLSSAPRQQQVFEALVGMGQDEVRLADLTAALEREDNSATRAIVASAVRSLEERGLARVRRSLGRPRVTERTQQVARLSDERDWDEVLEEIGARAPRQAETIEELRAADVGLLVADLSRSAVAALEEKGLVTVSEERIDRRPEAAGTEGEEKEFLCLTDAQQRAFDRVDRALDAREYEGLVLHGVTGSGKTEVYLHAIDSALRRDRGAIVLVPEISLTPQMVGRFEARFGERLALLHSQMGVGERYDEWMRVQRGDADVVVGARSAIFAPVDDIGVIVIDEEHERAYKQDAPPRYHAVEVARRRAQHHNAVLVLGSATPSLESYHEAHEGSGDLTLCDLPERIDDRPLPAVEIVDLRGETLMGKGGTFSQRLLDALANCLERGEQAMLFLNRRGFSTFVLCRECGFTLKCRDCSVSLIYHHGSREMRCHHCDFHLPMPDVCPSCESEDIGYKGLGTERVADQVTREFEDARVLRMDRDTTSRKGAHADILRRFGRGEANVLIGTQMIAKGHDFPNVTLVGVLNADTGLNRPDFRASEATFQLLTQVAGRAGRAEKPGRVLVQTYNPSHVAIVSASRHDYASFYHHELEKRRENMYPPFARLINLTVSHEDEDAALQLARRVAHELQSRGLKHERRAPMQFLGPAPAPLARLRRQWRYHLLLKGERIEQLRDALLEALEALGDDAAHVTADVDPLDMM